MMAAAVAIAQDAYKYTTPAHPLPFSYLAPLGPWTLWAPSTTDTESPPQDRFRTAL